MLRVDCEDLKISQSVTVLRVRPSGISHVNMHLKITRKCFNICVHTYTVYEKKNNLSNEPKETKVFFFSGVFFVFVLFNRHPQRRPLFCRTLVR